jgi:hypothetical protein
VSDIDTEFRCGVCDPCEEDDGEPCAVVQRDQHIAALEAERDALAAQLAAAREALVQALPFVESFGCPVQPGDVEAWDDQGATLETIHAALDSPAAAAEAP